MSAIATVLLAMGHTVTGSDRAASATTSRLAAAGVEVAVGHAATNVGSAAVVTASTAVPADNPELIEAHRLGVAVLRRAEILAAICATRRTVAVGGTHGKTTTSSMLFEVLRGAGWAPSCIIGGDLHGVGGGAVWEPDGAWLVVEADESDGTFLELPAEAVVVTNVEADHLELYGGIDALRSAFARFVAAAPGPRVLSADDPGARAVLAELAATATDVTTFGLDERASVEVADVVSGRRSARFAWRVDGADIGHVELGVPGLHNVRNAAAALAVAVRLGVEPSVATGALRTFRQVARRFEPRGERHGVSFVDDYGHLPSEVAAVLATARTGGWDRVVAVFQPHRYSRTEALHAAFADSFVDADVVVLTGIYPAGEAPRPGVTGELVAAAVRAAHPGTDLRYVESRAELAELVRSVLRPGDLCLTLGAGDLWSLPDELQAGPAW